ncbi:MAG: DUF2461 domain-containing protein [Candidatus Kapaibacterium sp.]|jgi:uncharacterized protein (TIGR02453 family)
MITPATLRFLKDIKANNNKEWFDVNRGVYEKDVKKPFRVMVSALIEKICTVDSFYYCTAEQAVFRINRDVRFSKNKEPYKTNLAAAIGPGGRRGSPSFYLHLEHDKLLLGGGAYAVEPEHIAQIRRYLQHHPDELPSAVAHKEFAARYGDVLGEQNKVVPAEFRDAAHSTPYLRNKQWYFMAEIPSKKLVAADDQVLMLFDAFLAARSVNSVLRRALGV